MLVGLVNHLWQCTIFAALAGLLNLVLRNERARVRYWIWLAASVKFLVPFSLLVLLGTHLASPTGLDAISRRRFYFAIQVMAVASARTIPDMLVRWLPLIWGVWLCGTVAVVLSWCARWRKISRAKRDAETLRSGRELQALRRVERASGIRRTTDIVLSKTAVEPGIFGVAHPVLMWPAGMFESLSDTELEAILTHEVQHLRRRDNLAAAIHMAVEAAFWFHPLGWWIGARLIEERERACDEEVLRVGHSPRAYAQGILKVCEFCLTSPLACMSGVAGGDLNKRMVSIMTNRKLQPMSFARKALIALAGVASIAGPIAAGLLHASVMPGALAIATILPVDQASGQATVQASKKEMMGLIVKKVNPTYPEAARKAHIQGEVVLRATIGKTGTVENLQAVSGPPELAPAAIEAVKQWKYRPYMKDGHAVEVETDITVNFTLAQ